MKVTEGFLAYVLDQLAQWEGVYTKRMFGGVGLFYEGLMFGLVYNNTVALKVAPSNQSKYIAAGEAPITIFKTNTPLPSYYTVPGSIFENANDFVSWAKESYQIQVQKL